jgi:hypothetical protein
LRRTLHKVNTYVGAQQDGNTFKRLFRLGEMNTLLKACQAGMDEALNVFEV